MAPKLTETRTTPTITVDRWTHWEHVKLSVTAVSETRKWIASILTNHYSSHNWHEARWVERQKDNNGRYLHNSTIYSTVYNQALYTFSVKHWDIGSWRCQWFHTHSTSRSGTRCNLKVRFPLSELTARVDGWPVSITCQHGPCWWAPGFH